MNSLPARQTLELPYTPPFDWQRLLRFFAGHQTLGIERVTDTHYARSIHWLGDDGIMTVHDDPQRHVLVATVEGAASRHISAFAPALVRMFDLAADPEAIRVGLAHDPDLARMITAAPGLRVPGTWSNFELIVRAIIGQQVSVKGATTVIGRVVTRAGELLGTFSDGSECWRFPSPSAVATADLHKLGMPYKRIATLQHVASVVASGEIPIETHPADTTPLRQALLALHGIGPWTVGYVAMRAWRDPDAWLESDLVLKQILLALDPTATTLAQQRLRTNTWRPWRSYAVMHLWNSLADRTGAERGG
ncbi:AlkA N-terminal domain-containing protein [Alcaligenaceae bacterium B3P038]|nr:AlkA N-terminal domain-containing protein [Alcaligenaceae bacterium B3P038]